MRYISTEIHSYRKYGDDKAVVKMLKDSGFTAYDFSFFNGWLKVVDALIADDYQAWFTDFRKFADGIGIACNQTHAPFPTMKKGEEEYNAEIFLKIVRAIQASGILGAKVCVIHPCNDYTPEENAEMYLRFAPYARKANVKIGVENMWNWWHYGEADGHVMPAACSHQEDFFAHMELLPKDVFVACVDIGHAEMMHAFGTDASKMIERLGNYMKAMHLHDVDLVHDCHSLPFAQKIDYAPIIEALRKIGYEGDITLEADTFAPNVPKELLPSAARYAAAVAEYFKTQLEK